MAIFLGLECQLCGVPTKGSDRLFDVDHFLWPDSEFWEYSDSFMHWDCYAKWEHRRRFARLYFEYKWEQSSVSENWGVAYYDENVLVSANPKPTSRQVDVMLAETGSWFRLSLANWEDWLTHRWPKGCQHEIVHEALAPVIPVLRLRFPAAEDVAAVVVKRKMADAELIAAGGMEARHAYEMACENLGVRSRTKGLLCPGCGNHSTRYRQVMIQMTMSGPQSYFQCYDCGQKFGPADVAK